MRNAVQQAFIGSIVMLSLFGIGGSAAAAPGSSAVPAQTGSETVPAVSPEIVTAGVDDFSFASYDADFYLDADSAGRSTLTTVETFVASFPDFDQNRGMRRAIPEDYQGAPTEVEVLSVTDETGAARPFTVETDDDGFVLVTSAAADFVQGEQTYVFSYTQHNVTRYFADTNDDEFYWDTVGTGWAQSFASVSARVHVPTELTASLIEGASCYQGYQGSTDPCEITRSEEPGGTVLSVSASQILPYANVTVAVPFAPQTFVPRDDSYFASPVALVQLLCVIGSVLALIWAIVLRATTLANGRGRPTIIAEYSPPKGLDVVTAAIVLKKTTRAAAAEFVDLAVKRRLRIVETEHQGFFSKKTTYLLELVDPSGLQGAALTLAQALFGPALVVGTGYLMRVRDVALSRQVRAIILAETKAATSSGLRKKGTVAASVLPFLLAIAGGLGAFVFGIVLIEGAIGDAVPFLLMVPPLVFATIVVALLGRVPLSDAGAEVRDHLRGLELYIRLAEADRLRMLQSPTGAEREAVSVTGPRQVLDIYEKLLPYAVLFNLEKEWAVELGRYYVDSSPDWYSGTGAFNAAVFASSIGSMSTTAANSYSGSSSSSSSGGSGGGGSSGGGGGGGGGGGV